MVENNIGKEVVNNEHDAKSDVNNATTSVEGLAENLESNPSLEGLEEAGETTEIYLRL